MAKYIGEVAEVIGFSPRLAGSAKELMAMLDECRPAGIVMDIVMPDIDGVELIQWLAKHNCTAPIVVVSGYDKQYAEAVKTIGTDLGAVVVGTLGKPFDIAELEACLEKIYAAAV
jgi:DNA-binding response OmpR family regulator